MKFGFAIEKKLSDLIKENIVQWFNYLRLNKYQILTLLTAFLSSSSMLLTYFLR